VAGSTTSVVTEAAPDRKPEMFVSSVPLAPKLLSREPLG
jgi:hypothetical protein